MHFVWSCIHEVFCCRSVTKSCPTLPDPTDCSTPGFPVPRYFLEFAQVHVHWISDAIQPSHPLSFPSPPAQSFPESGFFPVSQLFTSGGQSIGASASVLPMNTQGWFSLGWTGWISLLSKGLSRSQESSPTPQFKSINSSVLSFLYDPTVTSICDYWKKHSFD